MKKLLVAVCAASFLTAFAEADAKKTETEEKSFVSVWGFGNYGIYSGYQLYGSLVNNEPTAQGYVDANVQFGDIGYVGVGLWSNTDLTKRRREGNLGQAFNEYDPNVHFGRTFWFDDDKTWGLEWRSTIVWFYYPPKNYKGSRRNHDENHNFTTWDFDHSFALVNPYVVPYITAVREYSRGANLVIFGLKKTVAVSDGLSLTPYIEGVWRERQYNWCFPTNFNYPDEDTGYDYNKNSGVATAKIGLDLNYQLSDHFGLFAKVAYCCVTDPDLRDNVDRLPNDAYGAYAKDYAWGGVGVTFNF